MTKKQLAAAKAELAKLNAFIAEQEALTTTKKTKAAPTTGFARVIGFPNVANTEEYGIPYTYCEFVDGNDQPIGSPRGDSEAEATLKKLKAVRWGKNKRGKARFNSEVKAWSMQTEHVPSFVVLGTKDKNGKFTPSK